MDLVISVIAGDPGFILGCVASRFEIEEASLSLLRFGPEQFLLILPGVELVERVLNGRRPIITLSLRLHLSSPCPSVCTSCVGLDSYMLRRRLCLSQWRSTCVEFLPTPGS